MVSYSSTCWSRSTIFFQEKNAAVPEGSVCFPSGEGWSCLWACVCSCIQREDVSSLNYLNGFYAQRVCSSCDTVWGLLPWHLLGTQLPTQCSSLGQRLVQRNGIYSENFLESTEAFNSALIVYTLSLSQSFREQWLQTTSSRSCLLVLCHQPVPRDVLRRSSPNLIILFLYKCPWGCLEEGHSGGQRAVVKSSREELPGCLSNSEEPQGREQKDQGRKRRGDVRGNGADCAGFIKQQNEERFTDGRTMGKAVTLDIVLAGCKAILWCNLAKMIMKNKGIVCHTFIYSTDIYGVPNMCLALF